MTRTASGRFRAFMDKIDGFYDRPLMQKLSGFVLSGKYPVFLFILTIMLKILIFYLVQYYIFYINS